jgi:hypothetical protein
MRLCRSQGPLCFSHQDGSLVCPSRGAPLRSMPPLLRPDAPQDVAFQGTPQPGHPACYSGSQSVACDESFKLLDASAVAEDSGP